MRELSKRASRINLADLAREDEADRLQRYSRAWDAYDGEGPLPFDDEDGQAKDNVRLPYAELLVDKVVSFLAGKGGVEIQLDPVTDEAAEDEVDDAEDPEESEDQDGDDERDREAEIDAARERARAALDEVWPEEDRHVDFHNLATNGGVCGHAWLRIYEDGRVAVLDPSTVTVVWSADDIGIVERYLIEWNAIDDDGLAVARRHRIEPDDPGSPSFWTIYDEELDDDFGWVEVADEDPDGDEEVETEQWAHAYPPIVGCQNRPAPNTFYGRPTLTPAILDLIEQLESVASDMRRIVRLHGHPLVYALGLSPDQVQELSVAIGEMIVLPKTQGGENPGFGALEVAELTSAFMLYKELKAALFEGTKVPRVALGDRDKSGALTGVALQIEYAPLVELIDTMRLTYGATLRQVTERILDLRGIPNVRVTLGWPNILPTDEVAATESAEADLRMGIVSKQTIAEKRGYDWEVEQQRLAEQRDLDATALRKAFDDGGEDGDE